MDLYVCISFYDQNFDNLRKLFSYCDFTCEWSIVFRLYLRHPVYVIIFSKRPPSVPSERTNFSLSRTLPCSQKSLFNPHIFLKPFPTQKISNCFVQIKLISPSKFFKGFPFSIGVLSFFRNFFAFALIAFLVSRFFLRRKLSLKIFKILAKLCCFW